MKLKLLSTIFAAAIAVAGCHPKDANAADVVEAEAVNTTPTEPVQATEPSSGAQDASTLSSMLEAAGKKWHEIGCNYGWASECPKEDGLAHPAE